MFVSIQKKAFLSALSISHGILRQGQPLVANVIQAAVAQLQARSEATSQEQQRVFGLADDLAGRALIRFEEVAAELNRELQKTQANYSSSVDTGTKTRNGRWFHKQIVEGARNYGYYANMRDYHSWVRLSIHEERRVGIVISIHSFSKQFVGIMVAFAFLEYRTESEDGGATIEGPYSLGQEIFQFSYKESVETVDTRFRQWLEEVLVMGLDQWRRQI
jgi:hypothetical protein